MTSFPTPHPTLAVPLVDLINSLPPDARRLALFHYDASITGAWAMTGIFAVLTMCVAYQTGVLYRGRFMVIIVATGLVEVFGYATRAGCIYDPELGLFVVTSLALLIAPVALAFVNYLVAGWLTRAVGGSVEVAGGLSVSAANVPRIFLASDVMCLVLQGSGGAMLASVVDLAIIDVGNAVLLTGLAIQVSFFTAFLVLLARLRFERRYGFVAVPRLRPLFLGLVLTTLFMYVRNVFRILEYGTVAATSYANPGYIPSHEWMFWAFEAAPIALSFITYSAYPFAKYLDFEAGDNAAWRVELALGVARNAKSDSKGFTAMEMVSATAESA